METYIYIKNDGIQVVSEQNKQFEVRTLPLEQGAILNGVILNAELIQQALRTLVPAPKSVTLLLDSSNIMTKSIQLPSMKQKQLQQIVRGEFDLYQKEDQYIFDACVLSDGATMDVMAYAITREFLDAYLQVFAAVSISVKRVDVAINSIVKYISRQPNHAEETFLLNAVVGNSMVSILFEQGRYKLTNRVRLMQQGFGELYYQELYARLSSMVQFSQSQKSEFPITKSYYVGLSDSDVAGLQTYVKGLTSVEVVCYEDNAIDLEYFYPYTATIKNKRDVNFAIDHVRVSQKSDASFTLLYRILAATVVVAAIGSHAFYLFSQQRAQEQTLKTTQAYIDSADVQNGLATFAKLNAEHNVLNDEYTAIDIALSFTSDNNRMDADTLSLIFNGDHVDLFNYQYQGGACTIDTRAELHSTGIDYARALRNSGYFSSLSYVGHEFILEDGFLEDAYEYYTFHMSGFCSANAGGEG